MGPWTDVVVKSKDFTVFRDAYPVTEGHIPFVPPPPPKKIGNPQLNVPSPIQMGLRLG